MGSCLSKKSSTNPSSSSPLKSANVAVSVTTPLPDPNHHHHHNQGFSQLGEKNAADRVDEDSIKKEIFIIKHRKSHDKRLLHDKSGGLPAPFTTSESPQICNTITTTSASDDVGAVTSNAASSSASMINVIASASAPVRTSSCSKEEVDAILIQCGRLSRSSSGNGKAAASVKYSGSKRSYDFDHDDDKKGRAAALLDDDNDNPKSSYHDHRTRHRQSRASPSPHGRRRTPSRERDRDQQRSGSKERGVSGNGERRVSRSPARRRSENPSIANNATSNTISRPGKIVSVPATVSSNSLVMDKSNNEPPPTTTSASIKRVSVKRNVSEGGVTRGAASPRSQSPARANHSNVVEVFIDNLDAPSHQHQPSLSRSSSRKGADQSPYRRRPLNEISSNSLNLQQHSNKTSDSLVSQAPMVKPTVEETNSNNCKVVSQGTGNSKITSKSAQDNKVVVLSHRAKEDQHLNVVQQLKSNTSSVESMPVLVPSGTESLNPQLLTRSRSSRLSRDLDLNSEALLNATAPASSYAALLLEDIQNFHQKNSNTTTNNTTSFSLPPCVTKACSILEAVADLNSCTSSDRLSSPLQLSSNANGDIPCGTNLCKAQNEFGASGEPFVESELVVSDDLMEPSLHKYVTLRRGTVGGGDTEEQESSGSNSFISGQQQWEPNSANSTDRSYIREMDGEKGPRRLSAKKKRNSDPQQTRIERRRVGASRVAAST